MRIGIEQEFVFKDNNNIYLDYTNSSYKTFKKVVDSFPAYDNDSECFDCKSTESFPKRCYVEGFERYDDNKNIIETVPKGLELRTRPHSDIESLMSEFSSTYNDMISITKELNLFPVLCSSHPYKDKDFFNQILTPSEKLLRTKKELNVAYKSMFTHGLHINISADAFTNNGVIDLVKKINYYAPFILPFSFSSPFYKGELFSGLSYRCYSRANNRRVLRLRKRNGVPIIEFIGFDACKDITLLESLISLLKELVLDKKLTKRLTTPDAKLLEESSLKGFYSEKIMKGTLEVLAILKKESHTYQYLKDIAYENNISSELIKKKFIKKKSIIDSISNLYDF